MSGCPERPFRASRMTVKSIDLAVSTQTGEWLVTLKIEIASSHKWGFGVY
jgi:hypothetical protein